MMVRACRWAGLLAGTLVAGVGLVASAPGWAITGGSVVTDPSYGFVAQVNSGPAGEGKGCTGALVTPRWVLTAYSCLSYTWNSKEVRILQPTTVTVGSVDFTAKAGQVVKVDRVVKHPDRDLVLLHLALRTKGIVPVPVSTGAPAAGDEWKLLGFGRTATEWVPDRLHAAVTTVRGIDGASVDVTAADRGPTTCKGDAGGPAVRQTADGPRLVAIHGSSGQRGCLDAAASDAATLETRVDDIAGWVKENAASDCNAVGWSTTTQPAGSVVQSGDYDGDCVADALYFNTDGLVWGWQVTGDLSADSKLFGPRRTVLQDWTTAAYPQLVAGDFNGDGRTDLLRGSSDGFDRGWLSSGDLSADQKLFTGTGWSTQYSFGDGATGVAQRLMTGDFNGDGRTDLLKQTDDGALYVANFSTFDTEAVVDRGALLNFHKVMASGWTAADYPRVLLADVNGDGRTDLIGQNAAGQLRAWASTGDLSADNKLFVGNGVLVGTSFTTTNIPRLATGDFNGDGRVDLLGQLSSGALKVWASSGDLSADAKLLTGGTATVAASGWTNAAYPRILVGDFNGDGRTDIIGQASTGEMRAWASTGDLSADNKLFPTRRIVGSGWSTAATVRIL